MEQGWMTAHTSEAAAAPDRSDAPTRIGVEFVPGKRGAQLPCVDGYLFYSKDSSRSRFKCKERRCNATVFVKTDDEGQPFVEPRPVHDHHDHRRPIQKMLRIQRLRREVLADKNKLVPTGIIAEMVRAETQTDRRKSVDARLARKTRALVKQPQVTTDIVLSPETRAYVIFSSEGNDVIIFARPWGIEAMTRAHRICVDGTFRVDPKTHTQLLTFHVLCSSETSLPVAHVDSERMNKRGCPVRRSRRQG